MSDVIEKSTRSLPLRDLHESLGATFIEKDGWCVPASYGNEKAEYRAVCDAVGIIDLSSRCRISVHGSEAIMFLNGLVTNDMKTLQENRWMPAIFPTVQGRLIAATRIARLSDNQQTKSPRFLLETESATHDKLLKTIERFTLAGDFHVSDVTADTAQLTVQGPLASETAVGLLGEELKDVPRDGVLEASWLGKRVTIVRGTHTGEDGFDLIVSNTDASDLWNSLTESGAKPVGHNALEILRVEAGIAQFGRDMDEATVVPETNLDAAVSYTKGCYVGQEIIVRIKHRGHVAKKLTGLVFESAEMISSGSIIESIDGNDIGRITSVTHSPRLRKTIALGYVRYEYLGPATKVKVGAVRATVVELPFVRGSWN